jgi:ribonuclease P protein component
VSAPPHGNPAMLTAAQDAPAEERTLPALLSVRLRKHAHYGVVYAASRKHQSGSMSYFYRSSFEAAAVAAWGEPDSGIQSSAVSKSWPSLLENKYESMPMPRFGITVPRVLGPAVLRNRIKRRLRVLARAAIHLLPAGTDVILHPRPKVATMPHEDLQLEVESIFRQVARRIAGNAPNTPLPRRPKSPAGRSGGKTPSNTSAAHKPVGKISTGNGRASKPARQQARS